MLTQYNNKKLVQVIVFPAKTFPMHRVAWSEEQSEYVVELVDARALFDVGLLGGVGYYHYTPDR